MKITVEISGGNHTSDDGHTGHVFFAKATAKNGAVSDICFSSDRFKELA